jgi:hypothetical protein
MVDGMDKQEQWPHQRLPSKTNIANHHQTIKTNLSKTPQPPYYKNITSKPWKILVSLIQEYDPELTIMIQSHMHPDTSRNHHSKDFNNNNITIDKTPSPPPTDKNTSKSYTLNQLHQKHTKLFKQIMTNKLSANTATIETKFRKIKTPLKQIMTLIPKLTKRKRQKVLECLTTDE